MTFALKYYDLVSNVNVLVKKEKFVMGLGPVGQKLSEKLSVALKPEQLEVIDESHLHAGHAGAHEDGESHFRVKIVASAFAGKSLVQRHRMINEVLAEELKQRVHALAISAKAP